MRSHSFRIFRWHVLRYVARHRVLAILNIFSVALGVAVFLATQIANHSANRAFVATIDLVAGKADLEIFGATGNLREDLFPAVARQPGILAATPIVRGVVTLPDLPGEYLEILGIDVFTNEPFRTFDLTNFGTTTFDIQDWLATSNTIAISEEFAARYKLTAGDTIRGQVNGADQQMRIGFIMRARGVPITDSHFAAIDLGGAQELFSRRGILSAIQFRLNRPNERDAIEAQLRKILPPDATVAAPAQRSDQVEKMLGGFELNLTAMSLVSLLVGMFLIYNTVSASVVRRRTEIGILRSLGATRNEVFSLFLAEALILGTVGSCLGLLGGVLLARILVGAVAGTISSLYVLISVRAAAIQPWMFGIAWGVGVASVVTAAWLPARAAARMDPVRALHGGSMIEHSVELSSAWLVLGAVSIFLAAISSFFALATGPPWLGFVAAFFVLAGFSFIVPATTARFSTASVRLLRFGRARVGRTLMEAELAAANLKRALVRNSVTIAALAAAVAMTVGVSVMVFSFRQTVGTWVNQTLVADLFIAPASNEIAGPSSFIAPAAIRFLETHEAVAAVNTFRGVEMSLGGDEIGIAVVHGTGPRHMSFLHGDNETIMRRFEDEQTVLVSESFARRRRVRDGDTLTLPAPEGMQRFVIAGTFYDYTRDQGIVHMSQKNFVRFWHDDRVNSLAVYLKEKDSAEKLSAEFRTRFSQTGQFAIFSNASLRQRVFEVFDQTFAVTYVLRTIAVIVAVLGIFLSLTVLIAERPREFAMFRAIGGSAAQVRKLLLLESAMLGLLSGVIGVASGLCLSLVLTGVINRAFFGWTIRLAIPWWSLALTPVWIIFSAIAAGYIPARQAARLPLAESLRDE